MVYNLWIFKVKDLSFDISGSYLACAGTDVRVYQVKQWNVVKTFNNHSEVATGCRFGNNAKTIVSVLMDRLLKFVLRLYVAFMFSF